MLKHIQIVLGEPPVGREVDADWVSNAEREVRLVLAAPDLYAALLKLTAECKKERFRKRHEEDVHGMDSLLEEARQAIIAATGEEP